MKDPNTGKRPRINKDDKISDKELELAREKYMGKKVIVRGYKTSRGISDLTGICTFLGYNKSLPSWGLQITLDRMPLSNINLNQIELYDSR